MLANLALIAKTQLRIDLSHAGILQQFFLQYAGKIPRPQIILFQPLQKIFRRLWRKNFVNRRLQLRERRLVLDLKWRLRELHCPVPTQSLERETGIEPATNSLEGCDSTTELLPPVP